MAQETVCPKCDYVHTDEGQGQRGICPRCFYGIDVSGVATDPEGTDLVPAVDPSNPYAPPRSRQKKRRPLRVNLAGIAIIVVGVLIVIATGLITVFGGWFFGPLLALGFAMIIGGFFMATGG